jgi:xanthine dehydrogenase accessory factor
MSEIIEIAKRVRTLQATNESAWLATLVGVEGSAYRRPGARLLFGNDGKLAGCLSGGCVDREVLRTGAWLCRQGPALQAYDADVDDERNGWGSGCGGSVQVLVEPVTPGLAGELMFIADQIAAEQRVALATIIGSSTRRVRLGQRVVYVRGQRLGNLADERADLDLNAALIRAHDAERAQRQMFTRPTFQALVEVINPLPHLFIFGAGEDAVPVARFARLLDWNVTVCSETAQFSARDRFAGIARLKTGELLQHVLELDRCARPLALVMQHDYARDRAALAALLASGTRYIGMLGPARRTQRMLHELKAQRELTRARVSCVYAPVGLHLGAEMPAEIALSIVAEAQAVLAGADAGSLRDRRSAIHQESALEPPKSGAA